MEGKANIYTYRRQNGRKTTRKFTLPVLPRQAVYKFFKGIVTVESCVLVLLSLFSGRAVLSGGLLPFPAAVLASTMAIMPEKGIWVLIAAAVGIATVNTGYLLWSALGYLILLFLILGQARIQFKQRWYGIPLLILGLIVTVRIGIFAYLDPGLYNYLVAIFEGILSGCSSYLIIRALPVLRKRGTLVSLKKEEIIGGVILIVAFLSGLSELSIYGVEIKNVIARVLVLVAAYAGGSGFGAAMGTLAGIVPGINTVMVPGMVAMYSFSGMVSGMFRSFGRIGVSIGFILGNILLSIYLTEYSRLVATFTETGIAVLLFMLIPPKHLFTVRTLVKNSFFNSNSKSMVGTRIRETTASKVRDYSRIFDELSQAFREVSCDTRVLEENNLQNLFNGVSAKVCKGCSIHRICWEKEFYKTYRSIMDMLAFIDSNGRISEEHVPPDIQKRCSRLRELAITVNCLFETYKQSQVWQRKLAEGRDIIGGQLEGMSAIMQNLANELKIDVRMREDIEAILRAELIRAGYNILGLSVYGDGDDQFEINISCPSCGSKMECLKGIGPLVSRVLCQPLTVINTNYCTKKTGGPVCEFKLLPARVLDVDLGIASAAKDNAMISGDSYSTFELKDGKFVIILSDGMGVGSKAATESKAAITLLEKLLETGFDKNLAVKTVNSILVLGSPDETFATVDLAVIDMKQGVSDFIKIGSAPSFIKRGGQVNMIRANSLPIGIINNIEVDAIQQAIGHDDVLVMVSDGILESAVDYRDESWVMDTLQNIVTTDPQNIADLLLNRAIINSGGRVTDDMTVIAVRIVAANRV